MTLQYPVLLQKLLLFLICCLSVACATDTLNTRVTTDSICLAAVDWTSVLAMCIWHTHIPVQFYLGANLQVSTAT